MALDIIGEFYLEEKDGKPILVYHHSKYNPLPQIQTSFSGEKAINNHLLQPLFLCPNARLKVEKKRIEIPSMEALRFPLVLSPEYLFSTKSYYEHYVLPLFWCNNKDPNADCSACKCSDFGAYYYFCDLCDEIYHRECVESPLQIKHNYHPEHLFKLYYSVYGPKCFCCGTTISCLAYYCRICDVGMHPTCAMKPISFVVDQPKRHDHPLTLFHRKASLICNVCGLLRKLYPTYICTKCTFVAHNDCMYFPRIIKISRHIHRLFHTSSLQSSEWSCGVCRQNIDGDYGAYICDKCSNFAVHSMCALGKHVWDGKDLESVPEEDDMTQDVGPFDMISEGIILHFLHDHYLCLQDNILYDEHKFCQACVLPIFEGSFYSCIECDFILHETCAKSHRKIQHVLHPHPLTLNLVSRYEPKLLNCDACYRYCGGFVYTCDLEECHFKLDVRCVSVSEPLDYEGHQHPLYMALDQETKHICDVCSRNSLRHLNCITCNFTICVKCITLPSIVSYKHDKHILRVVFGNEGHRKGWCEVCEGYLRYTHENVIYGCNECCTTFHVECVFGGGPYLRPGQQVEVNGIKFQVLRRTNISRPFCDSCKKRCEDKIFKRHNFIACSVSCVLRNL